MPEFYKIQIRLFLINLNDSNKFQSSMHDINLKTVLLYEVWNDKSHECSSWNNFEHALEICIIDMHKRLWNVKVILILSGALTQNRLISRILYTCYHFRLLIKCLSNNTFSHKWRIVTYI